MGSGKGDGYPKDQLLWLNNHLPTFLAKTSYGKPVIHGKPLPKDDSDLSKWVTARWDEFQLEFKEELEATDLGREKLKDKFHTWFRNRKASAKRKTNDTLAAEARPIRSSQKSIITSLSATGGGRTEASSSTQTVIDGGSSDLRNLWSSLLKGTAITARSVFENEVGASVDHTISDERRVKGIAGRQHVGMRSQRLKTMWDTLDKNMVDEYEQKAEKLRNSEEEGLVYKNQIRLCDSITQLFHELIGPTTEGPHRIGHAQFHILYAYRGENDALKTGALDINGAHIGQLPFTTVHQDYSTDILEPWKQYSERVVPNNIVAKRTKFVLDIEGRPLLPEINETEITIDSLRKLITDYFEEQWELARKFASKDLPLPHAIPWNSSEIGTFVNSDLKCSLSDPAQSPIVTLFQMHAAITTLQVDGEGLTLFIPGGSRSEGDPIELHDTVEQPTAAALTVRRDSGSVMTPSDVPHSIPSQTGSIPPHDVTISLSEPHHRPICDVHTLDGPPENVVGKMVAGATSITSITTATPDSGESQHLSGETAVDETVHREPAPAEVSAVALLPGDASDHVVDQAVTQPKRSLGKPRGRKKNAGTELSHENVSHEVVGQPATQPERSLGQPQRGNKRKYADVEAGKSRELEPARKSSRIATKNATTTALQVQGEADTPQPALSQSPPRDKNGKPLKSHKRWFYEKVTVTSAD
ncbi:hypothetical protein CPC08DRAFT_755580 [Agrocybe pediades]|nr:hypothetical protein CPC08DRAFT_755580 [Agrocybe pediades]